MDSQVRVQQVAALPELLKHGTAKECRELIRCFVDSIELRPSADGAHKQTEPVAHEITINFKAMPALFVKGLGAGERFVRLHQSCWHHSL